MTDAAILAIATTVPPTLAALAALIVSLRTKTEVAEVKAVAEVTAGHVNSAATESKVQIAALQKEIAGLREDRAEKKQIAALAAQASAGSPHSVSMTNGVSVKSTESDGDHLEKIEKNTEETASNTAKTDATVAALKKDATPVEPEP